MNTQNITAPALPANNHLAALERKLGPIEYRRIDQLKPYERNLRDHPEKQIVKLMASIGSFGFALPILIDEEGVLITGHGIYEAARRLGLTEVPVLVATGWSKAQIKAYRIADNRTAELSTWNRKNLTIELTEILELEDISIELTGWDTAEIDLLLSDEDLPDPDDEVPDAPGDPVARVGDLWCLGKHRLLCGSALDPECWASLMDGKTATFVFQDFPYNVPISGHVCGLGKIKHPEFAMASGEMSTSEFTQFLTSATAQACAHLKDGGILTLAMDWRHSREILDAIEANALSVLNLCVWDKNNGGMGSLYRSKHELFWIAKKGNSPHTNNVQLGKYGRYRCNTWSYPGVNSFGKSRMTDLAEHPTVKPTTLVADAIRDVTNTGEIIIDGFMGSGTTILAAERTKRIAYGIEIEPGYIDVAVRRWEKATGGQAVLSDTGETFAEVTSRRMAEAEPAAGDEPTPLA